MRRDGGPQRDVLQLKKKERDEMDVGPATAQFSQRTRKSRARVLEALYFSGLKTQLIRKKKGGRRKKRNTKKKKKRRVKPRKKTSATETE